MVPGIINVQGKFLAHVHVLRSRAEVSSVHSKSSRSCGMQLSCRDTRRACEEQREGVWLTRRPEHLRGGPRGPPDCSREPAASLPTPEKRRTYFSFSACHENDFAHGWDPTLATNTPIDDWPQGAGSFLPFIRELLSVYDLRFAGLCCVGVIVFLQTHGIMFKSLDTLTPPSGFVFQMTAHYLLNTFYPVFFKIF